MITHPTCQCPYKKEHGHCHQECLLIKLLKLQHPHPVGVKNAK